MKLINKKNFFLIVCVSFTAITCTKLLIEGIMGFTDKYYTLNIFAILGFSVMITGLLALHFYLQDRPLIPVLIGQYAAAVGGTVAFVKLTDLVAGTSTKAMWQMILSVTILFTAGAAIYYITFFRQINRANAILAELKEE